MEPDLADCGHDALAKVQEAKEAQRPYRVVLIDSHLPEMDGFTLASRMMQDPGLATATIVMLASAGQRGDSERCRKLGITAYLTKPIWQEELLEALLAILARKGEKSGAQALVTQHSIRESRRSAHILLAEDNPVNRELIVRLLQRRGHTVETASNGKEAVGLLECGSENRFDAVLMDVQMPEMDGFEATAEVRKRESARGTHLPIIALTASAMHGDWDRCLKAGMDACMTKPIQPDKLFTTIETLVPSQDSAERIERARTKPGDALDAKTLLARVEGDTQLLSELAELFLNECPRMVEEIRQALAKHDSRALERAAHRFKGSAGNFSAKGTVEAALKLERIARSGNLEGAASAFLRLENEIARMIPALAALGKGAMPCEF